MSAKEAVDVYGFPLDLDASQQAQRLTCAKAEQQHAKKWKKFAESKRLPSKSSLKALIRKGVPVDMRGWVWSEVSGAAKLRASLPPNYYMEMVEQGQYSPCVRQIDLDLPRTFPAHPWIQSQAGQAILRRILMAYATRNPGIGYCQSMNYIAGFLLLVTGQQEQDAFFLMATLVEAVLYPDTYSSNLKGCHVEMRALSSLLALKTPRLHAHLDSLGADVSIIATDWYLCLFATTFPSETAARIWDGLLAEGAKVLYRVAVAHLQLHQGMLLTMDNAGELLKALKDAGRALHDRELLMRTAFNGVGSFPMARITQLRASHMQAVEEMVREREARKRRHELKEAISSARQMHSPPPAPEPDLEPPASGAEGAPLADLQKTLASGLTALTSTLNRVTSTATGRTTI